MARPTIITEDTVSKLEAAFRDGLSVSEACFVSAISRTAYYDRRAADDAFAYNMDLAKAWATIRAKKVVIQAIDRGDLSAAKWYLERKSKEEYGLNAVDEDMHRSEQDEKLRSLLDTMSNIASEK
jgi:hypothetical protein